MIAAVDMAYRMERKARVDAFLEARLPALEEEPRQIHAAMRKAALSRGKRLRPLCSMAVADLAGAAPESVLAAGCAVELAHTASLILDDLPCMDDAQTRRGQPCVHVEYGTATAILAAMGLLGLAFEWAAENEISMTGAREGAVVRELAQAIGSRGLVGGQHLDLCSGGRGMTLEALEQMHHRKAGALFLAALRMPAMVLDLPGSTRDALDCFGRNVGLAFQITDDLIDAAHPGEDEGKCTMVAHLGREQAARRVEDLIEEAIAVLTPYGDRAVSLQRFAAYVRTRNA